MLSPRDIAYPVLKASPSAHELDEVFTPTLFELGFAERKAREAVPRIGLLLLLSQIAADLKSNDLCIPMGSKLGDYRERSERRVTTVVNAYAQFPLQRLWGSGKSASADGIKWNLYPQNLMSEFHIRYGGYGGIGYYLLADCYIALVSRFSACGS